MITGTSSGFGLLTSIALAKDGFQVVATMRDVNKSTRLLETAREAGVLHALHVKPLDVTDFEAIPSCVDDVVAEFGRIDVLVNNAGVAVGGFVEDVPLTEWQRQFDTNVYGAIACTQAVLPIMRAQQRGKIINISSISGRVGFPGLGPYSASKFALEGLSESLRLELLPYNIYVSLVEPGPYKTDIWEKSFGQTTISSTSPYQDVSRKIFARIGKIADSAGNPDEVVEVIRRIVRTNHPKLRYPVGREVKLTTFLKGVLPWAMVERIARKQL